jgi:amino acid adenylation domain-containing protein
MSVSEKMIEELSPRRRELLELVLDEKRAAATAGARTIPKRAAGGSFAASFAQQRLWFLDRLRPGEATYNIPFARRLSGRLDREALQRSLNAIIQRHEVLRARFVFEQGGVTARISDEASLDLEETDLRSLPDADSEGHARALIEAEAVRPFDLSTGPLVRARLIRLCDDDHVVLLNMHHIVSDGWSLGLFVREMAALYKAFSAGAPSPLDELPIQYGDFAEWQRNALQEGLGDAEVNYWKARLADLPEVELPADRPRNESRSSKGATVARRLPPALLERLKTFSLNEQVTLFVTLLAAFDVLLYRYTGEKDFAVGSPVANRDRTQTEALIGFFVNTLLLRARLSDEMTFRELVSETRTATLEAFAHQGLPFEKLVQLVDPNRDTIRSPLFQVMFTLQNVPLEKFRLEGLEVRPFDFAAQTSMFDLTLTLMERSDRDEDAEPRMIVYAEYNTGLFEESTIERLLANYFALLESAVVNSDCRLADLSLMQDAEHRRIVVEWNETSVELPSEVCWNRLFEEQVARSPDSPALILGEAVLSYGELNRRSNQLAAHLRSLGAAPESLVGIWLPRGIEMTIALIAVLKSGGAFVLLDPAHPKGRLESIVHDAGVKILLMSRAQRDSSAVHDGAVVFLDSDSEQISRCAGNNLENVALPENCCYAIYTSGSTGAPKGVLITHRALINHNFSVIRRYGLRRDDRVLQFAAPSFDVAVEEVFPTLLAGAAVVVGSGSASTVEFGRALENEWVTVINLPASFWSAWSDSLSDPQQLTSSLRLLVVGSERVSPERFDRWLELTAGRVKTLNAYGTTEATITATIYDPAFGDHRSGRARVPVGRPLDNARTYVLQPGGVTAPIGVAGELYIAGEGLARGYLGRPDLTAERFLPDQSSTYKESPQTGSAEKGERLYRTGDLARYRENGDLELLGRVDNQIKIRGYRIEPAEIELALLRHGAVQDAFVTARDANGVGQQLVAYVVAKKDERVEPADLRRSLKELLPDYMTPASLITLEALPRKPNGKVDEAALPRPGSAAPDADTANREPQTQLEKTIAAIWQEVLRAERVGLNDNFFDIGGHSLLMAEIQVKLQTALKREIAMVELFEYPTVSLLARFLGRDNARPAFRPNPQKAKDGASRLRQQFKQRQLGNRKR